jgi:hypothetical protein
VARAADALNTFRKLDRWTSTRDLVLDHRPAVEQEAGTTAIMQAIAYDDHLCLLIAEAQRSGTTLVVADVRKRFASFRRDS